MVTARRMVSLFIFCSALAQGGDLPELAEARHWISSTNAGRRLDAARSLISALPQHPELEKDLRNLLADPEEAVFFESAAALLQSARTPARQSATAAITARILPRLKNGEFPSGAEPVLDALPAESPLTWDLVRTGLEGKEQIAEPMSRVAARKKLAKAVPLLAERLDQSLQDGTSHFAYLEALLAIAGPNALRAIERFRRTVTERIEKQNRILKTKGRGALMPQPREISNVSFDSDGEIDEERLRRDIAEKVDLRGRYAAALIPLGPKAKGSVRTLIELSKDEEPAIHIPAAQALRAIGSREAIAALIEYERRLRFPRRAPIRSPAAFVEVQRYCKKVENWQTEVYDGKRLTLEPRNAEHWREKRNRYTPSIVTSQPWWEGGPQRAKLLPDSHVVAHWRHELLMHETPPCRKLSVDLWLELREDCLGTGPSNSCPDASFLEIRGPEFDDDGVQRKNCKGKVSLSRRKGQLFGEIDLTCSEIVFGFGRQDFDVRPLERIDWKMAPP